MDTRTISIALTLLPIVVVGLVLFAIHRVSIMKPFALMWIRKEPTVTKDTPAIKKEVKHCIDCKFFLQQFTDESPLCMRSTRNKEEYLDHDSVRDCLVFKNPLKEKELKDLHYSCIVERQSTFSLDCGISGKFFKPKGE